MEAPSEDERLKSTYPKLAVNHPIHSPIKNFLFPPGWRFWHFLLYSFHVFIHAVFARFVLTRNGRFVYQTVGRAENLCIIVDQVVQ